MSIGLYISHPQVEIDPKIPVEKWGLSKEGKRRAHAFAAKGKLATGAPIFSSKETKAMELAQILAHYSGSQIISKEHFGENDRSATGYLPPNAFEQQVTRFFARTEENVAGWESAVQAQTRIIGAVANAMASETENGPVIFTGHGCVGTLLKCYVGEHPIKQSEDQREMAHPGGGNVFAFDLAQGKLLCDWTPMEDWTGVEYDPS